MQVSQESTVTPDEIDSLGHMNVRYYVQRMTEANRALLAELGAGTQDTTTAYLRGTDTYTRFRQEQFEGAALITTASYLGADERGLKSYVEIKNAHKGETAATFIVTTSLIDRTTRQILPFSYQGNARAQSVPDYAQPRSLSLDPPNLNVGLDTLYDQIPEVEGGGMMSGRRDTLVEPGDVGEDGWLREDLELMFLPFAKLAAQEGVQPGPPVFATEQGQRVGWAVMETRTVLLAQPRLGDELAYFSADLSVADKTRLSRRWAFNKQTGQMLGLSDTVGLCIDLDARRAVPWPDALRDDIERNVQPQLA